MEPSEKVVDARRSRHKAAVIQWVALGIAFLLLGGFTTVIYVRGEERGRIIEELVPALEQQEQAVDQLCKENPQAEECEQTKKLPDSEEIIEGAEVQDEEIQEPERQESERQESEIQQPERQNVERQDREIQQREAQDPEPNDLETQDEEVQDEEEQEAEVQEEEIQDPEEQDPEIQEPEEQEPEVQDSEVDDPDPNDPGSVITSFTCVQAAVDTIRLEIAVQGRAQPFSVTYSAPGLTCGGTL